MSSPLVQMTRQAQNLASAVESIREAKMSTPRLDEAMAEPMLADLAKVTAALAEMAELVAQQSRALDHVDSQVLASQEATIKRLHERVDKLEKAPEKAEPKSQPKPRKK